MNAIEELQELIEYCNRDVLDGVSDTEWVKKVATHAINELNRAYDTQYIVISGQIEYRDL